MRGLVLLLGATGMLSMALARPIVGVLLYYWISLMSPQMDAWGVWQTLPWALVAALATLIGCAVAREPRRIPAKGMVALVLAFVFLSTIASVFALVPGSRVFAQWSQITKEFLFVILAMALMTDRRRIHAVIWVIVISLGFYGVVGGVFAIVTAGHDHVWGPPNSMIRDNNQLALALLMTLPLMNYLRQQSAHRIVRIGFAVAMLLTLLSVLASYSRGAFLGLAAVTLFFWLKSKRKIVSAVILAAVLTGGLSFMPAKWTDRMWSIQHYQQDGSAEGRLIVWREAYGIALARPLTGCGYKCTATASVLHQFYPDAVFRAVHNIWLQVLSENGFPAFFVWVAMTVLGIVNTRRIIRVALDRSDLAWARDFAKMAQVSIIGYLSAGSFLSMAYYNLYFLILAILAVMAELVVRSEVQAVAQDSTPLTELPSMLPSWRDRRVPQ